MPPFCRSPQTHVERATDRGQGDTVKPQKERPSPKKLWVPPSPNFAKPKLNPHVPQRKYFAPSSTRQSLRKQKTKRRLDFSQALLLGLAVNAIGFFLLYLLFLQKDGAGRNGHTFEVGIQSAAAVVKQKEKPKAQVSSASASSSSQASSKAEIKETPVPDAWGNRGMGDFAMSMPGITDFGMGTSTGDSMFGIGNALGRQGLVSEMSTGDLSTLFDGKGLGDGSNMVIYVDRSRSMLRYSRQVTEMVGRLFPNATIVDIMGCAIVEHEGFVRELESNWSLREKIFFVSDLRDQMTYEGLQKLRSILVDGTHTRELHIISFERPPPMDLKSIITESWGSTTVVHQAYDETAGVF